MSRFPDNGTVLSITGTSIPTTYTGTGLGSKFYLGTASKARFVVTVVTAASSMTAYTLKLQGFDSTAAGPCDFVAVLDSTGTTALEQASGALSASGTATFSFHADLTGFDSIRVAGKATGASAAGDSVTVTCVAF